MDIGRYTVKYKFKEMSNNDYISLINDLKEEYNIGVSKKINKDIIVETIASTLILFSTYSSRKLNIKYIFTEFLKYVASMNNNKVSEECNKQYNRVKKIYEDCCIIENIIDINPYINEITFMELNDNFSEEELISAFKKLSLKYHPDKQGGSSDNFIKLTKCKEVLLNYLNQKK